MPTVGVYVPSSLARNLAHKWRIEPDHPDFYELVRGLAAEALDQAANITHPKRRFHPDCANRNLHQQGHRCRHCGGS